MQHCNSLNRMQIKPYCTTVNIKSDYHRFLSQWKLRDDIQLLCSRHEIPIDTFYLVSILNWPSPPLCDSKIHTSSPIMKKHQVFMRDRDIFTLSALFLGRKWKACNICRSTIPNLRCHMWGDIAGSYGAQVILVVWEPDFLFKGAVDWVRNVRNQIWHSADIVTTPLTFKAWLGRKWLSVFWNVVCINYTILEYITYLYIYCL